MTDINVDNRPVVLAVERAGELEVSTTATTPTGVPNVFIKVVSPMVMVAVRVARTFLQSVLGLLSARMTGLDQGILPANDFWALLVLCAGLSVGSAIVSGLQNILELLVKFDQSNPTLRG